MRIGTWNLDARWTDRHRELLELMGCDLLLLTEVPADVELTGMVGHHTRQKMARHQSWSAIYAPELWHLPDPHPATALAEVDGIRVCSTVLPWQGCAGYFPWGGDDGASKTAYAVDTIVEAAPEIWGGDWNTSFAPKGYAASAASRPVLQKAATRLRLSIATADLSAQADADLSIDHVAVPDHWTVLSSDRLRAEALSDHDVYVIDVRPA